MSNVNLDSDAAERSRSVERGQRLEYFTIFWNSLEALAALISGFFVGSVALVGFGLDSLIEVVSGAALLWRLHQDANTLRRERVEKLILPAYLNRHLGVFNIHYLQYVRIDDSPGDTEYQFTVWAQKMPVLGSFRITGNNVTCELVHVVKAVRAQGQPTHLLTNEVLRLGSIIGEVAR